MPSVSESVTSKRPEPEEVVEADSKPNKLWNVNRESQLKTFWWFYTWPIKFLLNYTIPSPKTNRRFYPLTFILCIVYIGVNSFMIFWMVAIIGYTLHIPDTVMGMTFLAWGGCLPEAISSVIMIRKGKRSIY